ncbi:MAG TPA: TonB-dependent receptor [Bryobacteraceae bacterium]|jgi:hypothetical protein
MRHVCTTALALVFVQLVFGQTGQVAGTIVDAHSGEALSKVDIQLAGTAYRTRSDEQGRFRIETIPAGDYVLNVSTVGYRFAKKPFHLDDGETKQFDVVLSPGTLTQTTSVDVKAGPFDVPVQAGPAPLVLAGNDVTNLGSVLANDPLRAVQDLPGVSSNDDFEAKFTLRGADFSRIGIYMDGVLLHSPLHTLESTTATGSESAFNGGMVESLELYSGPMPPQYSDRTAGALDVHSRDGGRDAIAFRAEASFSNAGVTVEGPIDKAHRGSWLVSARKSYLQYLIDRIGVDTSLVFGLEDVQARFTYDLTPRNFVSLDILESYTNLDRTARAATLGVNSLTTAGYDFTVVKAGWRYTPSEKFILNTRAAWTREKFDDENPKKLLLGDGYYGEWIANQGATLVENPDSTLDFGWSVREIRDQGYSDQYQSNLTSTLLERYNGKSTRGGAYLGQSWSAWSGLLRITAGGRWDRDSLDQKAAWLPQASLALSPLKSTRFTLAWGEYAQYPEVSQLTSNLGNRGLLPARTIQLSGAVEQRIGERTRLRAEFYDRTDRDLIWQPLFDPRILAGKVFVPSLNALYYNSLRGYSRGFEVFLQRVSANRLTGWVSYAYGHSQIRDGVDHISFPSDFDQRHSVNVYAGYRLRPSVNLSLRSVFGTGFPLPGFLIKTGSTYYLTTQRNGARLGNYERTDFRVNKNWTRVKWKTTLYGEVVNITNQTNYRFDSFNGYNASTRQAFLTLDKLFPILPSLGLVVER